jgi:hypothetical protein
MEELFELIYFFIPLALILFFRFFSNRNSRNNKTSDSADGSRGQSNRNPGPLSNFFLQAGNQVREFLGIPTEPPTQGQSKSNAASSGGQKRPVPKYRSAQSIASTMYRTGNSVESGQVVNKHSESAQSTLRLQKTPGTPLKGLKKIQQLPELQKAIIWNEVLNKPKGW